MSICKITKTTIHRICALLCVSIVSSLISVAWSADEKAAFSEEKAVLSEEKAVLSQENEIFAKLEAIEKETHAVSFDFTQVMEFTGHDHRQEISGSFFFQKPENIRYELTKPTRQLTIIDGKRIYNYNAATNQVVINDWRKTKKTGLFQGWSEIFSGNFSQLRERYEIELTESTTDHILITLKDAESDFSMRFFFEPEKLSVKKTEFETEGTKITTNISNYRRNPEIKRGLFRFVIPRGAEVIRP